MMNVPDLIRPCLGNFNTFVVFSADQLSCTQPLPVRLQGSGREPEPLIDLSLASLTFALNAAKRT